MGSELNSPLNRLFLKKIRNSAIEGLGETFKGADIRGALPVLQERKIRLVHAGKLGTFFLAHVHSLSVLTNARSNDLL